MTTDERLDRLTERHEALAQSLELTVAMHKALEAETAKLAENMNRFTERMDKMMLEIIAPVARMVLIHEQRLNKVDPSGSTVL